jgi:hypothetical protein
MSLLNGIAVETHTAATTIARIAQIRKRHVCDVWFGVDMKILVCVCVKCMIGIGEWSYGVMVSTLDFESSDPGSSPGRTSFFAWFVCACGL